MPGIYLARAVEGERFAYPLGAQRRDRGVNEQQWRDVEDALRARGLYLRDTGSGYVVARATRAEAPCAACGKPADTPLCAMSGCPLGADL